MYSSLAQQKLILSGNQLAVDTASRKLRSSSADKYRVTHKE